MEKWCDGKGKGKTGRFVVYLWIPMDSLLSPSTGWPYWISSRLYSLLTVQDSLKERKKDPLSTIRHCYYLVSPSFLYSIPIPFFLKSWLRLRLRRYYCRLCVVDSVRSMISLVRRLIQEIMNVLGEWNIVPFTPCLSNSLNRFRCSDHSLPRSKNCVR